MPECRTAGPPDRWRDGAITQKSSTIYVLSIVVQHTTGVRYNMWEPPWPVYTAYSRPSDESESTLDRVKAESYDKLRRVA